MAVLLFLCAMLSESRHCTPLVVLVQGGNVCSANNVSMFMMLSLPDTVPFFTFRPKLFSRVPVSD